MEDNSPTDQGDELSEFEHYGKTPPRTRILRRNRERSQRDKPGNRTSSPKVIKAKKPLGRSKTINSMFDELISKADSTDSDQGKRISKRSLKLLRGSERDLKLDISGAQLQQLNDSTHPDVNRPKTPSVQIETCKRFKSLCSRRVPYTKLDNAVDVKENKDAERNDLIFKEGCPHSRVEFHQTLSLLVRMGCGAEKNTKRVMSREEYLWQNELKDIIWLELQAYHADRTPMEEDSFLCCARESVAVLLNDIITYRFQRHNKRLSANSSDSGVEDDCSGCFSMYCQSCMEAQNEALNDVEKLMKRLETAEALFPSSKAFGELYPLYNSPEFVGRVKAMCLWYNMTRHQRLKLVILGRLLAMLENKYFHWPLTVSEITDNTSPTDSNNSSSSSVHEFLNEKNSVDCYNITTISTLVEKKADGKPSLYRRYIENILKTRGLGKSLNFLDTLHRHVLRKAQITLEKPDEIIFTKNTCDSQEEEMRRYGVWSPESQALGLPSYKSSFLFLSAVPLEVIHEFLLMRIEQKPKNPSPLSVRQLMRELKEGLKIATLQRQRFLLYVDTVFIDDNESKEQYQKNVDAFDDSLLKVFSDYLSYLEQWALLQHDTFQKSLLEEEWQFSSDIVNHIPGGAEILGKKFSSILCSMLKCIGERLMNRIDDIVKVMQSNEDEFNIKQNLFYVCREVQYLFKEEREMSIKCMAFCKILKQDMPSEFQHDLKRAIVSLKCTIPNAIDRVQNICNDTILDSIDESEKASLLARTREILMQGFRFGFEFHKEMADVVPNERREQLAKSMTQFAHIWMKFVTERCERGRGMRPRWAYQGLDFLLTVCEPQNTMYLSDEEFEDLKKSMDVCISHVIGTTAPSTPDSGIFTASPKTSLDHVKNFPRSRGSSPSPRPTYKSQRSSSRKTSMEQSSPLEAHFEAPNFINRKEDPLHETLIKIKLPPALHSERVQDAVEQLENEIDERLRNQQLIGTVINVSTSSFGKAHIKRRYVTFSWQRGIKIGQGRFGKVYTAVNNDTGDMMALKEIPLQHNDTHTIVRVAEELKILEGISHQYLVRYYGLEVHREEMLIFMEFCAEGTLENLVAATELGLPELLVRRYAYQLISGVSALHDHGIVHRDLKTANIFLTDEGNCLKIGDFGCAAKLKSHSTMPGELKGFVGTQAYMAPEVFTKTMHEGHGRAADVWSIGCVIVEMASGKRPWAEYDSNYQIMFKVGMGESPEAPANMIDEGLDFLQLCFKHNPKDRATAKDLLVHNFVKVGDDLL